MLRLTRAGALAFAIVALSLTVHVLAGGMAPGPVGLAVVTVPVLGLCFAVTSQRLRLPALTGLFAVTQIALHRSFEAFSTSAPGALVGMPGEHGSQHLALSGAQTMAGGAAMGGHHGGGTWMTLAHVLATLLCVLVLTRGEAAVWALWQRLVGRVPSTVATPVVAFTEPSLIGVRVLTSRPPTSLLRVRGPPRVARPA